MLSIVRASSDDWDQLMKYWYLLLITYYVIIFGAIGRKNKNRQNMRPQKTMSNLVTQSAINGHTPLVCL